WAVAPLARLWPKVDWMPRALRAKTLLTNLALDPPAAYANSVSICRVPLRRRVMNPDLVASLDGHDPTRGMRTAFARVGCRDPLAGMIAADIETLLPDDYLVKVDRASMAHGVEVRP